MSFATSFSVTVLKRLLGFDSEVDVDAAVGSTRLSRVTGVAFWIGNGAKSAKILLVIPSLISVHVNGSSLSSPSISSAFRCEMDDPDVMAPQIFFGSVHSCRLYLSQLPINHIHSILSLLH